MHMRERTHTHTTVWSLSLVNRPSVRCGPGTSPRAAMCVRNVDVHVSCSSHVNAQLAAFFIDPRAKGSTEVVCIFLYLTHLYFRSPLPRKARVVLLYCMRRYFISRRTYEWEDQLFTFTSHRVKTLIRGEPLASLELKPLVSPRVCEFRDPKVGRLLTELCASDLLTGSKRH
jgi:hypothetical protein